MKETANLDCKRQGLRGLGDVVRATGMSHQCLGNWWRERPELFKIILAGVVAEKENQNN